MEDQVILKRETYDSLIERNRKLMEIQNCFEAFWEQTENGNIAVCKIDAEKVKKYIRENFSVITSSFYNTTKPFDQIIFIDKE